MGYEIKDGLGEDFYIGVNTDGKLDVFIRSLTSEEKDIFDAFLVEAVSRIVSKMLREGYGKG